jgi:hypothetical protein
MLYMSPAPSAFAYPLDALPPVQFPCVLGSEHVDEQERPASVRLGLGILVSACFMPCHGTYIADWERIDACGILTSRRDAPRYSACVPHSRRYNCRYAANDH